MDLGWGDWAVIGIVFLIPATLAMFIALGCFWLIERKEAKKQQEKGTRHP